MDDVDITSERTAVFEAAAVAALRAKAQAIPEGTPGDCEHCGEESKRLVGGYCCRCRDKLKLP